MMREPTTEAAALRWHTRAINDLSLHLPIENVDGEDPHAGWFKTRLVKDGPYVPVHIYWEQEICPDTGELLSDEVLKCKVNGQDRDAYEVWTWVCQKPISQGDFNYLVARAEYARTWAPDEPPANPFQKTDWLKVPLATFQEGKPT